MAMFDKKKPEEPQAAASAPQPASPPSAPASSPSRGSGSQAVIGATIEVKGDISGNENLIIEGSVEGSVTLDKHDLTIGESAKVHANVSAKVVRIDGEVVGDVRGIEKVVMSKVGRMQGNLSAPRVVIEDGAKFRGSIEMDGFDSKKPRAE